MNTVNKQTAFALKEAGFPQPSPQFGQVWYHTNDVPLVVVSISEQGTFIFTAYADKGKIQQYIFNREVLAEMAFAPNAVDILAEMPLAIIRRTSSDYEVRYPFNGKAVYSYNDCPHEAMAAIFLKQFKSTKI